MNFSFYFYKDKSYGKDILEKKIEKNFEDKLKISDYGFLLKTTYPGLLIGSGYMHPKLKENKDDFQLGFDFDYTTGLPIIRGSTIKGVIRSAFPEEKDIFKQEKEEWLEAFYKEKNKVYSEQEINEIFESGKVIFHDAYIKDENKEIFADDYITPHKSEIENPIPIKFLIIKPDVVFRFQFDIFLEDKDFYLDLFKHIILYKGLGAKTNLGYGVFQEVN